MVRAGGLYIIEDWSWSFQDEFQNTDHPWASRNSLANLVIDLMEDMALSNMVAHVTVTRHMVKIRRTEAVSGSVFAQGWSRRGRQYNLL
jgi:hypothetical protein